MISRDSDFIQLRAQVPLQLYVNGSRGQINGLGASFPEQIAVTGLQEKATSKKPSHHQQRSVTASNHTQGPDSSAANIVLTS